MSATPAAAPNRRYHRVSAQKAGGATYTPAPLADFVARKVVQAAQLHSPSQALHILDPAVGDGALLLSLLAQLREHLSAPISAHGFDTDPAALASARRRLRQAFPQVALHLAAGNFLDSLLPAARRSGMQFDLIIANPPYVRTQILGAERAQELAEAFGLSGRIDLYYAFLLGIAQVLRPGGAAGVIVSNRFMTTRAGAGVRAALRQHFTLRQVWDLGDTKLFDAAVLPAVIVAQAAHAAAPAAAFTSIYETDAPAQHRAADPLAALEYEGVVAVDAGRRFCVRQGLLDLHGDPRAVWCGASPATDSWLRTVAAHTWGRFRDIGRARVGVKSCADSIFIRCDWHELPPRERPELLRPIMTHHIARRFRARLDRSASAYEILYPHESAHGERKVIALEKYPRSRAYLEKHRAALETRRYLLDAGRRWYELWVPQDPAAWSAPKLVFRDIAKEPTFWIDHEGHIVNGDCYWMIAETPGTGALLWLAVAVASSTFCTAFYDQRFNNRLYAGRRRFIAQYVEEFPLPDPAAPLGRELIALAQTLHRDLDKLDAQESAQLAERLNAKVWAAFGLAY